MGSKANQVESLEGSENDDARGTKIFQSFFDSTSETCAVRKESVARRGAQESLGNGREKGPGEWLLYEFGVRLAGRT